MLGPGMGVGITDRVVWWVQWVCQIVGQRLPGSFSHWGQHSGQRSSVASYQTIHAWYHIGLKTELGCCKCYKGYKESGGKILNQLASINARVDKNSPNGTFWKHIDP